jgi:hypothetical protein
MPLSLPRRFICDLLHASRNVTVVVFERRMDLAEVVEARRRLAWPPSWSVLLAKAFAMVAAGRAELRRSFVPWPRPHLWQADQSIAAIAFERDYEGESAVFFGLVRAPDRVPLADLTALVQQWKTRPIAELRHCRRMLKVTRLPRPLRRLLWWYATSWSGRTKARLLGTFAVSLTGAAGAAATNLISPLSANLNTGVLHPDGSLDVRLHVDHRVLDGMPVARALSELEAVLRTRIVAELEEMDSFAGPPATPGRRKASIHSAG